jgi:hypothetical protein
VFVQSPKVTASKRYPVMYIVLIGPNADDPNR